MPLWFSWKRWLNRTAGKHLALFKSVIETVVDDCIRLIARRVEDDVTCSDGKSPRLCLPSRFALGLSAIQDQDSQWLSERDPQDEKAALLANMLFHPTVRIFVTKTHEHTRAEL